MVHYGKEPTGELLIRLSPEEMKDIYQMLLSAQLPQRRTFYGLKAYIEENYREQILNQ